MTSADPTAFQAHSPTAIGRKRIQAITAATGARPVSHAQASTRRSPPVARPTAKPTHRTVKIATP